MTAVAAVREALEQLAAVDARLELELDAYMTLDPAREQARSLAELGALLLSDEDPAELCRAFAAALQTIALAQLEHFPGNLFWDFDFMAAELLRSARQSEDAGAHIDELVEVTAALMAMFGCKSPIRFRYVHDFTYGLDWGRWVSADPARARIGPFDLPFVRRLEQRGREIRRLIERDDADFPRVAAGAWRNPFRFSRRPEHEAALHRDLAARGALPVENWRCDAVPDWRRPTARLRIERARALGIPGNYN